MSSRALVALSFVFAALFLCGCPSQQLITKTPTVEDADDQQATCKVAKDPLNPLVVEWPGTSKVDFESSSKRGVVVVSYVGCNMKILSGCQAEGAYDYTAVTPARDRLEMKNQNELYARLPLAAASLKGELSQGAALELEYIAVGQRIANKPPVSLSGSCDGATHYVRSITVGAFKLDALAAGKAGLGVDVGGAGVGAGREENARKIRSQGNVEKCAADPNAAECGATLQLGLAPLSVGKQGAVTSAGFGAGVGPLGVIPTVSTMTDVSNVGVGSLKDVDLAYLDLVQAAKRADKDATLQAESKAQTWDTLAKYPGQNPLKSTAEKRREEWLVVAEAQARRRAQLETLRTQYNADKEKLDKLTALDDDVVPKDQKEAYRKEFEQVYKPFDADLKEIGAVVGSPTDTSGNTAAVVPPPSGDTGIVDVDSDPFLIGTPLVVEAELGYGSLTVGQNSVTKLGGGGVLAGAQFGLGSIGGSGVSIMATFRSYTAIIDTADPTLGAGGTALTFGGALGYTLPLGEDLGFGFGLGVCYGTFVGAAPTTFDTTTPNPDGGFEQTGDTPSGIVLETTAELSIPFDVLHLALRGIFAVSGMGLGDEVTLDSPSIGGGATLAFGIAF